VYFSKSYHGQLAIVQNVHISLKNQCGRGKSVFEGALKKAQKARLASVNDRCQLLTKQMMIPVSGLIPLIGPRRKEMTYLQWSFCAH